MNEFKKKALDAMKKFIASQSEEVKEEKKPEELTSGSKAQVKIEYYEKIEDVDITPFVEITKIEGEWAYILESNGRDDVIELEYLEPDMIQNAKYSDNDSKETKIVKHYINMFHKDMELVDDKDKIEDARECVRMDLYDEDEYRMPNEILIRRAHDKYLEFSTKKITKDFQESKISYLEFIEKMDKAKATAEMVMEDIFDYGVVQEKENMRREAARRKNEKEEAIKKENLASSDSFDAMFGDSIDLLDKMITDLFGAGQQKLSAKEIDQILGLNDEEEKEDDKNMDDLSGNNGLIPFQKIIDARKKKELPDCLIDMTELAAKGKYEDIIGREDEIATVAETLARKEIRNPLLVGKPGAGKTAVVQELVKRSLHGEIPHLKDKYFYELRMNDLVAGTMYRGQLEEKLQNVMKVLEDDPNVILFIDEIHMIVQAGATVGDKNDVANALKPYLTSDISIIGATTFDEYSTTLKDDGALARRFNTIMIEEKSKEEVVEILKTVKQRFEEFHKVELSPECVERIVDKVSTSKIDNSLIAGSLCAIDTICTKMKIHEMDEDKAFGKWEDEAVLSMDRKNNGGRTGTFGFQVRKPEEVKVEKESKEESATPVAKVLYLEDKEAKEPETKEEIVESLFDGEVASLLEDLTSEELETLLNFTMDEEDEEDEDQDNGLDA